MRADIHFAAAQLSIAPSAKVFCRVMLTLLFVAWLNTYPSPFDSETAAVTGNPLFLPLHGSLLLMVALAVVIWPGATMTAIRGNKRWYALAIWCLTSALWSADPGTSAQSSIYIICGLTAAVLVRRALSIEEITRVLASVGIAVCAVSIAMAIVVPGYGLMTTPKFAGQLRGIYNHKNLLAAFTMTYIVWFYGYRRAGYKIRKTLVVNVLLLAVVLVWAWSVTSMVTVLIVIALCEIVRYITFLSRSVVVRGLMLLVLLLGSALSISSVMSLVLDAFDKDVTLSGRTYIWAAYIDLIEKNPWLGVGYNAAVDSERLKSILNWDALLNAPSPHNSFLQLAVGAGLIATTFLVLVLLKELIETVRRIMHGDTAAYLNLSVLLGYILLSLMEGSGGISLNAGLLMVVILSQKSNGNKTQSGQTSLSHQREDQKRTVGAFGSR